MITSPREYVLNSHRLREARRGRFRTRNKGDLTITNRILVTYASRTSSTGQIEQAIGNTLTEAGASVDVIAMTEVRDLSLYRAVAAGCAIRGAKWLPEAVEFILAQKRFAMFTVCISMAMKNAGNYRSGVLGWVAPVRAMVRLLSEGLFAGRLDFAKMRLNKDTLLFAISVALGRFPRGDHRDWNAIRLRAESLKPVVL